MYSYGTTCHAHGHMTANCYTQDLKTMCWRVSENQKQKKGARVTIAIPAPSPPLFYSFYSYPETAYLVSPFYLPLQQPLEFAGYIADV